MQITKTISFMAMVALSLTAAPTQAQQNFTAPAEQPPQGYSGAQYVDSKGCVYIRAGTGGSVIWVPRVTRDRKPVCGFEPTFTQAKGANRRQLQTQKAQSASVPQAVPSEQISKVSNLAESGSLVVVGVGTAVTAQNAAIKGVSQQDRVLPRHLYEQRKSQKPVKTPRGFRPAWQDGRMNPRRAEQTLAGQAQMQQIWTNTVPRRLVQKP